LLITISYGAFSSLSILDNRLSHAAPARFCFAADFERFPDDVTAAQPVLQMTMLLRIILTSTADNND
jgi:hypothetical protein